MPIVPPFHFWMGTGLAACRGHKAKNSKHGFVVYPEPWALPALSFVEGSLELQILRGSGCLHAWSGCAKLEREVRLIIPKHGMAEIRSSWGSRGVVLQTRNPNFL
jgi:hypothetical protein